MGILMLLIKFSTTAAHLRRSLALSAPMNRWTGLGKYVIVPGVVAGWWEQGRHSQIMANL